MDRALVNVDTHHNISLMGLANAMRDAHGVGKTQPGEDSHIE